MSRAGYPDRGKAKFGAWAGAVIVLAVAFAASVILIHNIFTVHHPGAADLYPRWVGARAFWREGLNPYSEEVSTRIQEGFYGRLARPGEDKVLFVYPFYVVFLLWPLVWFPYHWVQAFWMTLLVFLLLGGVWLIFSLYEWRPSRWLLAVTSVWVVLFYHSARLIILGQFAGLVFFCLVLSLWLLENGRDGLAGVVLGFASLKPQMVFLVVPLLAWWGVARRRWAFVGALAFTLAALFGASWLLLPSWPGDFLRQVAEYPAYTAYTRVDSPVLLLTGWISPRAGRALGLALSALLVGYAFWAWSRTLKTTSKWEFHRAVGIVLIVTCLVAFRTATTNFVVLLLPTFLVFRALAEQLDSLGEKLIAATEAVSLVGLWILFAVSVTGNQEHPVMFLPWPFALLAVFVLGESRLALGAGLTRLVARR